MSKSQDTKKNVKKAPTKTMKEKKASKREKKGHSLLDKKPGKTGS